MISWEYKPATLKVILEELDETFDARGMKSVYGRGDSFVNSGNFHMDVWQHKSGDLYARFWSHSNEVDRRHYLIKGMADCSFPKLSPDNELWIPFELRTEYENWIKESV